MAENRVNGLPSRGEQYGTVSKNVNRLPFYIIQAVRVSVARTLSPSMHDLFVQGLSVLTEEYAALADQDQFTWDTCTSQH